MSLDNLEACLRVAKEAGYTEVTFPVDMNAADIDQVSSMVEATPAHFWRRTMVLSINHLTLNDRELLTTWDGERTGWDSPPPYLYADCRTGWIFDVRTIDATTFLEHGFSEEMLLVLMRCRDWGADYVQFDIYGQEHPELAIASR